MASSEGLIMVDTALFDLNLFHTLMDLLPTVIQFMTAFFIIDIIFDVLETLTNISKARKVKKKKRTGKEFAG